MVKALLFDLRRRGVTLEADGDAIRYEGPLTECDIDLIHQHKTALLEVLTKPPAPVPTDARGFPTGPCAECGERHFWRSADGWRCSDCCTMPAGFRGETATLPSDRFQSQEG